MKQIEGIFEIDIDDIEIDEKYNVRTQYGDMNELSELILINGITTPIMVEPIPDKPGKFWLRRGHRRYRGLKYNLDNKRSPLRTFPAQLVPASWDEMTVLLDMEISNSGLPLNLLEKAEIVKRMIEFGLDDQQVSERMGKSITFVRNCHKLLSAPSDIKKMIKENKISSTTVISIMKKKQKDGESLISKIRALNVAVRAEEIKQDMDDREPTAEVKTTTRTINHTVETEHDEPETRSVRITETTINELEEKKNSVNHMKHIVASKSTRIIRHDHLDLFNFIEDLFADAFTKQQLEEMFYEPDQLDGK
jgi:ParB family chromosome partitioning protein